MSPNAEERAGRLKLMIFDVDGVLTDGTLYLTDSGEEIKGFNVRDGHGMKMLQDSGVAVAIITARRSRAVELRARDLGIGLLHQGVSNKAGAFSEILSELRIEEDAAGYMGDDLLDLQVIERCGFAATVPEAPEAVRSRAHYVARSGGGRGAAREVCELIMRAQGTLDSAIGKYARSQVGRPSR